MAAAPKPAVNALSDEAFTEIERLLNCAIHELVFASHHAEEDQPDEAADCLVTARMNIDRVLESISAIAAAQQRAP